MNRIQLLDLKFTERISEQAHEEHVDHAPRHEGPSHRFFLPMHYEKNYAYPLLIWLHGPASNEDEIKQVMPHVSLRNYIGIAPRGYLLDQPVAADGTPSFTWDESPSSIEYAASEVLRCIRVAKQRFHIADRRVFLAGHDIGGTLALRLGMAMSNEFGGAISIGGKLPRLHHPLADLKRARSIPLLISYGRDSKQYNSQHVRHDLRLLHAAGLAVTLRQYPCSHEVTTQMLTDLNAWVMERVTGTPSSAYCYDDPTHLRLEDRN